MKIVVKKIPFKSQKYETLGDYWMDKKGVMQVRITSQTSKEFFTILIHELIEAFLAKFRNIDWDDITQFDVAHPDLDEPGESKFAPYHKEHIFATQIEKLLVKELGLNWKEYNN